jgi:hypothetical protein
MLSRLRRLLYETLDVRHGSPPVQVDTPHAHVQNGKVGAITDGDVSVLGQEFNVGGIRTGEVLHDHVLAFARWNRVRLVIEQAAPDRDRHARSVREAERLQVRIAGVVRSAEYCLQPAEIRNGGDGVERCVKRDHGGLKERRWAVGTGGTGLALRTSRASLTLRPSGAYVASWALRSGRTSLALRTSGTSRAGGTDVALGALAQWHRRLPSDPADQSHPWHP